MQVAEGLQKNRNHHLDANKYRIQSCDFTAEASFSQSLRRIKGVGNPVSIIIPLIQSLAVETFADNCAKENPFSCAQES